MFSLIMFTLHMFLTCVLKTYCAHHRLNLMSLTRFIFLCTWTFLLLPSSHQWAVGASHEYTNEFAVHLKSCEGDDAKSSQLAQELAHRYGFINHGKVCLYSLLFQLD